MRGDGGVAGEGRNVGVATRPGFCAANLLEVGSLRVQLYPQGGVRHQFVNRE